MEGVDYEQNIMSQKKCAQKTDGAVSVHTDDSVSCTVRPERACLWFRIGNKSECGLSAQT